jgi:Ankyrin repeats (3 copies)
MPSISRELITAVRKGDRAAARRLIRNGSDPNSRDAEGLTALMWAAREGHPSLANILLKAGVDPNARDRQGQTAVHHAVIGRHRAVIRALASAGADLNAKDADDCTAFELASLAEDYKTAKELSNLGAKGSPPDPGVLSIGNESKGSNYRPIHEAIDLLSLRLDELPEHNPWGTRGHLYVIFQTTGSTVRRGRHGIQKKTFSKQKRVLITQVRVPKSLTNKRPVEFLLHSIHEAIDLAEPIFKRARIDFPAAAIREYLQAIGLMKNWEFPDFRN